MNAAIRLAALYGGMFLVIGIMMPYWPVWLEAKGLSASEIGIVIAAGSALRVFMSPLIAHIADKTGKRRQPLIFIAILTFIAFLPFAFTDDFWMILVLQAMFAGLLGPLMPLSESLTMMGVRRHGLDYGRIRLWGSITFIIGASGVGFYLKSAPAEHIWAAVALAMSGFVICTFFVPDYRDQTVERAKAPLRSVLSDKTFLIFVLAGALIQGSHGLYYTFGTINWLRQGIDEGAIGLLWAEGVVAEVILFVFAAKFVKRIGPTRLIALGGLACLVRWGIAAETDSLSVIILLQVLHAFTFGATHLGAMYFISERMPDNVSATAQTAYALVVSGLGVGLTSLWSGYLYEAHAGKAYYAMAVMGACGMILAWSIRRR